MSRSSWVTPVSNMPVGWSASPGSEKIKSVGSANGAAVGPAVGAAVGPAVGAAVGAAVGVGTQMVVSSTATFGAYDPPFAFTVCHVPETQRGPYEYGFTELSISFPAPQSGTA